jgi:hypothetical protein
MQTTLPSRAVHCTNDEQPLELVTVSAARTDIPRRGHMSTDYQERTFSQGESVSMRETSLIILEHPERPGESRQKFAGQLNLRMEEV